MLPLLTLASAEIRWQLEVDMRMAALLEVGRLSPGCLFQSIQEVRQVFAEENETFLTATCGCLRAFTVVAYCVS